MRIQFWSVAAYMAAALPAAVTQAATTVEWTVVGSMTPSSCAMQLGDGGKVNIGTVSSATVRTWLAAPDFPDSYYKSSIRQLMLTVDCPSPTKMALSFVDNRSATVLQPLSTTSFGLGRHVFSGMVSNIGEYQVSMNGLQIRTSTGSTLMSPAVRLLANGVANSGSVWARATGDADIHIQPSKSLGFAANSGASAPDFLMNIVGPLDFSILLHRPVVNGATTDINLDGAATVTLTII